MDAKVKTGLIAAGIAGVCLLVGFGLALLLFLGFVGPFLNMMMTNPDQISPEGVVLFWLVIAAGTVVFAVLLAVSVGAIVWAALAGRKRVPE